MTRYALVGIATLAMCAPSVHAAPLPDLEEIRVTGSHIRGDAAHVPPVRVFDAADMQTTAGADLTAFVRDLTFSSGTELNLDPFTQNISSGTANINLRALGLSSTLVLIDGARQVTSAGVADDGSSFVDLNALIPPIMIERMEVLKDGASALYGSDAMAGVVNVISHRTFDGFRVDADLATIPDGNSTDAQFQAMWGTQGTASGIVIAGSFLKRDDLPSAARDFTHGKSWSSYGQPGAYRLLEPSAAYPDLPAGAGAAYVMDPACGTAAGGVRNETVPGTDIGTCLLDYAPFYQIVPEEERLNLFASGWADLRDGMRLTMQVGYARTELSRDTSPSFPILNPPTVAADHPANPYGVPVAFRGRVAGELAGPATVVHNNTTWQARAGLEVDLSADWMLSTTLTHARNTFDYRMPDTLADRFYAALNGQGGPDGNLYYNPFGSALTADAGSPLANDPAVLEDMLGTVQFDFRSRLTVLDAVATGTVMALPAGDLSLAVGVQGRKDQFIGDYDADYNAENFLFNVGGPDFSGTRDVLAAFVEASAPITPWLDLQAALRHERHDGGINTTDPRVALRATPTDALTLRAAWGTSFRAPTAFQTSSAQTVLTYLVDPVSGEGLFRAVRTVGNPDLKPEQGRSLNAAIDWQPTPNWQMGLEVWSLRIRDIIVRESAQALVNDDPYGDRLVREGGELIRVNTQFINAARLKTSGIDLRAAARFDLGTDADLMLSAEGTYMHRYRLTPSEGGTEIVGEGSRNFNNFGRSVPRWRGTYSVRVHVPALTTTATLRHIGSYRDDQNGDAPVRDHLTVDLSADIPLSDASTLGETRLTLGVRNLFNRMPPELNTNAGYDTKVHDGRGRIFSLGLNMLW